jgi:hypothetical protein
VVITPITLAPRDGLRVVAQTGPFLCQADPDHIAFIIAERARRQVISDINYRRFG